MDGELVTVAELRSLDEQSRLRLRNVTCGDGQNFHSLLLERLVADSWVIELSLTSAVAVVEILHNQ
jgi:hypothetical protein